MAKGKRLTEDDIVKKVARRLDLAYQHDRDNQIDAAEDLKFLAGDQWNAADRAERERQSRPCLTIDRLGPIVNQIINDFKQNPPAIRAAPADGDSDKEIGNIHSGIMSEIQYRSNATNIFGNTFGHAVSCGIGHWRIVTDYVADDSFDQEILLKRIANPLSVFWDPDSIEPDRSDANWSVVTEMMSEEAFREQYPNAQVSSVDVPGEISGTDTLFWSVNDQVRIAEYWEKVPVKRKLAMFENGATADITDMTDAQLRFLPPVQRTRTVDAHKVKHWLVSGSEVLSGGLAGNDWAGIYIPIFPVIGREVPLEKKMVRSGLIRHAKDAQVMFNYMRSATVESIGQQPKAPYLATAEMIGPFKAQWDTQNTVTRPYLLYKPDPSAPGGRPMREPPPILPAALVEQSQQAGDEIKAVTGVFDASMGNRSNETSGRAIIARANQGNNGSYHFIDNFNASLTHCGRAIIDLIPKIYDSERTVKLMSEEHEEPKFVKVNTEQLSDNGEPMIANDLSKGRYDVRVKLGPSYLTRRMEAAESMMTFVQAVPQAASVIGDLIAQSQDWPGADKIAERLKRMVPPQMLGDDVEQTPEQMQAQQEQAQQAAMAQKMQMDAAQADLDHKKASATKLNAEAMLKQIEALILQMRGPEGQDAAPRQPAGPNPVHAERGAELETAMKFQQWRREAANADRASAGTQGALLDNMIKRRKLGQPDQHQF